jgi:hypothetical protein
VKRLRICLLGNGLANQVFQYIFGRYIELESGDEVFYDDSPFWIYPCHNGYEIEKVFPYIKKPKLLSKSFSDSTWNGFIEQYNKKHIYDQLKDIGVDMMFVLESHLKRYMCNDVEDKKSDSFLKLYKGIYMPTNTFNAGLPHIDYNTYFYGYWCSPSYFRAIKHIIADELQFPVLCDEKNSNYAQNIVETYSVAVHIRRGDHVDLGYNDDCEYFTRSISIMNKWMENPTFFVFSDDIAWCKSNADALGLKAVKHVFIEDNKNETAFKDLQLMSMCKAVIKSSRSSFSTLAVMLNKNDDVIVLS